MDSLKGLISSLPEDTVKLKSLLELSGILYRLDPDEGITYANQTRDLAEQLNRKEDLAYALKFIGLAYYFKSDFPAVLFHWEESLKVFQDIPHPLGISNLLSNLGAVYFSKGDDPKALEYYFESLRVAEEIGDVKRRVTAYINIGAVYTNNEATYDQALETLGKALKLGETINTQDAIGTSALNIGDIHLKREEADSALYYFEKAFEAFQQVGGHISTALNFIGKAQLLKGNFELAINFFNEALEQAQRNDAKLEMAQVLASLGDVYQKRRNYNQAIYNYSKSQEIAEVLGANNELRNAYEGLAIAYAEIGEYQLAYEFKSKFSETKDLIRTEEYDERIGNLRFQFDLENKEKEITLLNKDNDIKKSELKRAAIFRNFLFAVAGLLLIIGGGIYFQYRFAKKSNKLLEKERNRSEAILLNILPKDTAEELKLNGFVKAQNFKKVSILFIDFKAFTKVAEKIPAGELVKSLDYFFKKFDDLVDQFQLEKIKTIGDSYMCAGGLPIPNESNPQDAVNAAFAILDFVNDIHNNPPDGIYPFDVRIGINTGSVIAGVVGTKKFQYDIWGSSVNIAARMESGSIPGKINISENTYQLVKDQFECSYRGEIEVKNGGKMKMYFVDHAKSLAIG